MSFESFISAVDAEEQKKAIRDEWDDPTVREADLSDGSDDQSEVSDGGKEKEDLHVASKEPGKAMQIYLQLVEKSDEDFDAALDVRLFFACCQSNIIYFVRNLVFATAGRVLP